MMKKNILAVALLSSALVIGSGVALAHGMRGATEVEAAPVVDGTKLNYVQVMFQLSDTNNTDCADNWEGAYYYLELTGGAKDTTAPGIELFHQPGESKMSAIIDASEYVGWTSVKVHRGSAGGEIYQSTAAKTVSANTKNFFKFTYGRGTDWEAIWWRDETPNEERFARIEEYAVIGGEVEAEALATESCWNSDTFNPTTPSRAGYVFDGWFTDTACTLPYAPANIVGDSKIYAKFTPKPWDMRGEGTAFSDKDGDGNTSFDGDDALVMTTVNASEVKIENVSLKAGDIFKFTDTSKWFGYTDIKTASPDADKFEDDGTGNIKVKTTGSYTFFVNVTANVGEQNAIWVTSTNAMALDSWAQGFVEAEDLCNGIGDEWSTFATSYAALSADVKAYFAATKIEASNEEHASWVAKAAYRYEKGVVLKDRAKFAEDERPYDGYKDKYSTALSLFKVEKKNNIPAIIIATVSLGAIAAAAGFVFLRKKRNNA